MDQSVVAVVLAAGKGTRMKSRRPKVLHEIAGKPLVSWSVDAVRAAGCSDVVVVVGHGSEAVAALLDKRHPGVRSAIQSEQKGTGHAVMMALPSIPAGADVVVVVCGDTPRISADAIAALVKAKGTSPMALWTTQLKEPRGYGRIVRGASSDGGDISAIVEEKDATPAVLAITEVNPGVYAFDVAFLRAQLPKLTTANAAGELYLTDLVRLCVESGSNVASVDVDAGITLGINDRVQLADAEDWARTEIQRRLLLAGVTLKNRATTSIEADVVVGEDVVLEQGVSLRGSTRIGRGVIVGQGAVLTDTIVADDVVIHPYSVCDKAVIGTAAVVGPFSRLRPEADVGEGAHVGNFVELKKTKLGKGSKANHLAYLGDADIGAGVNVGAGTITCNYDGIGKHKTVLSDGVFVGSNATLVAPLLVGKDAYIAAGSVVTDAVPDDAVAFGRARQTNKEGHAKAVREKNAERKKKG
ncbi:MAG: bifunctional UDP-N-acetylglucosamine diphosphorylase/glucosamine-1-phosphate N-acetyltransferase GlmU [Deltaproteobacteria bacterium]|nr:bifunctional UDP-N-acetylglucosamine diphosphorylase/glucosamine-1-phosphate N-acetyltransferase GlmU [Deltaproteobacteria bacterium]